MHAEDRRAMHESIVHHVREVITVVDVDGTVRFVNDATASVLGHDPSESEGREAVSYVHPDDQPLSLERRSWLLGEPGRTTTTVLRVADATGGWRYVETHGVNLTDDPHVRGILYVTRDVEDRARAELSLVHALATSRVVADLGLQALRSPDVDAVVHAALGRATSLLGTSTTTLLLADGAGVLRVRAQSAAQPLQAGHRWDDDPRTPSALALTGHHPVVVDDLAHDERVVVPAELAGMVSGVEVPLEGPDGAVGVLSAYTGASRLFSPVDVQFLEGVAHVLAGALLREQREQEAVVEALHDPLTGLPTRTLFLDRLRHALERTLRGGGDVAVLMVDLDRFKEVNDVWGHAAGDAVLREVGVRLASCARVSDTVARHGGDEFVVLCEGDVSHVGVARVAAAIRRACAQPFVLPGGEPVLLSASVGSAWSVEQGADANALLATADASMYFDKSYGLRA